MHSTVTADPDDLPADARVAAAWVVREGVTNVLRHSSATWCRIAITRVAGGTTVEVRVDNDGVAAAAATGYGSGLAGLAERLRPTGGGIATQQGDGVFSLRARLTGTAPSPAAAPTSTPTSTPAPTLESPAALESR